MKHDQGSQTPSALQPLIALKLVLAAIFIASNRLVGILPILRVVTISRTTTCLAGSFNFVDLPMLKFRSSPSDIFNIHVLTPNR